MEVPDKAVLVNYARFLKLLIQIPTPFPWNMNVCVALGVPCLENGFGWAVLVQQL